MNYKELTEEELNEMLANATKTYYSAGGHTKARLNEIRIKELKEEMTSRGMVIPTDKILCQRGMFNGNGAV